MGQPRYDLQVNLARVGKPGNQPIGIKGFEPPNPATVPAHHPGGRAGRKYNPKKITNYQELGAVPYTYEIGQYEITAKQYVSFLNAVDPSGSNKTLPWTGINLYTSKFSPIINPYQGQIVQVEHAPEGEHYALADARWSNKPIMWANMFQYLYFINALSNGTVVAETTQTQRGPTGNKVETSTKYVQLSDKITNGSYNLNDYNYPFAHRQNIQGFVLPSQDEWIKAAYYNGSKTDNGTSYYYYPTSSNTKPEPLTSAGRESTGRKTVNVDSSGNVITDKLSPETIKEKGYANYNSQVFWAPPYTTVESGNSKANVTDVGGAQSPSPWLTYDQGGNLVEYTDTSTAAFSEPGSKNKEKMPAYFKVHGGIANATEYQLWLTATGTSNPYGQVLGSMHQYGGARIGYLSEGVDPIKPQKAKPSRYADPLTGEGVVTRVDSLDSFDTLYTTSNQEAIQALNSDKNYVFMAASFYQSKNADPKSINVYSLFNDATKTHYYTTSRKEKQQLMKADDYSNGQVAFRALLPGEGSTDFIRYFNSSTGAYGFSAAAADEQFFTSRGYVVDGVAWSI